MIISESDDHDRADDNLVVDDPRLVLGGVHTEDGSLFSGDGSRATAVSLALERPFPRAYRTACKNGSGRLTCGVLRIGVPNSEPKTPPFELFRAGHWIRISSAPAEFGQHRYSHA